MHLAHVNDGFALREALKAIKPALPGRGHGLPVLTHVRIDSGQHGAGLSITATNLDLSIKAPLQGYITEPLVIPYARLEKMVAKQTAKNNGPVDFHRDDVDDDDKVRIEVGTFSLAVPAMGVEEWPKIPWDAPGRRQQIDLEALADVAKFASTDEGRPILTGVQVWNGGYTATDTYRLAHNGLTPGPLASPTDAFLVPAKVATLMNKALPKDADPRVWAIVEAWDGGAQYMVATIDGTQYRTRLIEGEFPNWRNLIPEDQPDVLEYDRDALIAAVTEGERLLGANASPTRLTHNPEGGILVERIVQDEGHFRATVPGHAPTYTLAFNGQYLLTCLDLPEAEIRSTDSLKPITLRQGDRLRLLMPIRVS